MNKAKSWITCCVLFHYFARIEPHIQDGKEGKRRCDAGMQNDMMSRRHGIVAARKISLRSDLEDPYVAPGMWCHQQKGVVERHGPCNSPNQSFYGPLKTINFASQAQMVVTIFSFIFSLLLHFKVRLVTKFRPDEATLYPKVEQPREPIKRALPLSKTMPCGL